MAGRKGGHVGPHTVIDRGLSARRGSHALPSGTGEKRMAVPTELSIPSRGRPSWKRRRPPRRRSAARTAELCKPAEIDRDLRYINAMRNSSLARSRSRVRARTTFAFRVARVAAFRGTRETSVRGTDGNYVTAMSSLFFLALFRPSLSPRHQCRRGTMGTFEAILRGYCHMFRGTRPSADVARRRVNG